MAKNRYAGNVSWTEGQYHDPQMYVKGIEMKQGRLPNALKTAMKSVIEGILENKTEDEITPAVEDLVKRIVNKEVSVIDLCVKAKLSKNLTDYSVLGEARAGAHWANVNLGKGYRKDDYFLTTINDKGEYIAFDDPSEIEGIAQIGYKNIVEKFIYAKVKPYYEVMGWDIVSLENAMNGMSGMAWL